MKGIFTLMLALMLSSSAMAGPSKNYYEDEVRAATRMAYNLWVLYDISPVVCNDVGVDFDSDWYWPVQQNVNAYLETLPTRERNRVGSLVGWYVWNAIQDELSC